MRRGILQMVDQGLSPRVRGNPSATVGAVRARGAGAVYPRVCGGTLVAAAAGCISVVPGLSPRVRGNLRTGTDARQPLGSIPACAGEPGAFAQCGQNLGVYPRVCGGTTSTTDCLCLLKGLSPRVRGNPAESTSVPSSSRSIPACAGEPCAGNGRPGSGWVYPRVCGGTSSGTNLLETVTGLSPRVRGNRASSYANGTWRRSIPACAGEPLLQTWKRERHVCQRSIPACAGEPITGTAIETISTVYPRVCGGT